MTDITSSDAGRPGGATPAEPPEPPEPPGPDAPAVVAAGDSPDAPSGRPSRFSFSMPAGWIKLDLSDDGPAAARRFVEQLVATNAERDRRREIKVAAALQGTVRTARRQGAVLAAFWSQTVEGRQVGASVMVALRPLRPDTVVTGDGTVDLDRAVRTVRGDHGAGDTIVESSTVELPAGPARRVRKSQIAETLGRRHQTEVVQYFLVTPDRRSLVVVTFSTPTVELVEPLAELFDAMIHGLRWRW